MSSSTAFPSILLPRNPNPAPPPPPRYRVLCFCSTLRVSSNLFPPLPNPTCSPPLRNPNPRLHSRTFRNVSPSSLPSNHIQDESYLVEEAQEAVSLILQESGVPTPISGEIASNAPKYVEMLMEGVRDLDEHSLWSSWAGEMSQCGEMEEEVKGVEGAPALSYKKKVYMLAKEKCDKGMLPFLESIGLSLSSSMHLARYLSSVTLPTLIHKVNYVKKIFFSGSDDGGLIGSNARRMMMHLSVGTDEDIQQTLSFFEKIEARRGGLNMLGSKDAAFRYLVESFPRLLLLSLDIHMKPMVKFFEDLGVPSHCMRNVLLLFPPIMFFDIETLLKPRLKAFEKIGAVDNDLGKMLVKYPWIVSSSIQGHYEEILVFFDAEKVPKLSVNRAIKTFPYLLGSSTSKLKLMMEEIGELGLQKKKMGQIIATSSQLLLRKPHELLEVVSFFEDLGYDRKSVGRILGRCPEIFATSIENTLKKKLEFLASIGVSKDQLPRVIVKYPELFVSDIDKTLRPRMKFLQNAGLSKNDVASMVRRFSPLLGYSIDKVLIPKLEFLEMTMERPVKDVVDYPRYFSYSLEKKIKPRFFVLKRRNIECSLKDMLSKNDEEFAAEYLGIGRILVPPP